MADVFVSYSRTDSTFVEDLVGYLESQERDVWLDKDDIAPADDWQQDIYNNIDDADSFVFVVSAKSLESEYCGKELDRAQKGGKRIIPLACDSADPDAAPTALAQLNWIWCRDGDDHDAAFAKLISALETDLAWAKAHTRLLVRAVEWDARGDGSLLLRGADLKEAEQALAANAGKQPAPTELQQRYVLASRRAATRRQRIVLVSVAVALAVSLVLGVLAILQRNNARAATRSAGALAGAATASDPRSPLDVSLLLSLASYQANPGVAERSSVVSALESARLAGLSLILHGHTGTVLGVAFSPSGRTLASASSDGTVRLWDLPNRRLLGVLRGDGRPMNAVAFGPNGGILAAGDTDGTVRLWRVRDLRPLTVLHGHIGSVNAVAFSHDGRTLASGGTDETVRLWSTSTWKPLERLGRPGHTAGAVHSLAFSPHDRTLASGTDNGIELWNLRTDRTKGAFGTKPGFYINGVAFSRNGMLASAGQDGTVRLWNVHGKRVKRIGKPLGTNGGAWVHAVAFSPDGRTLAAASADGTVRIWYVRSRRRLRLLSGYAGDVFAIAFAPGGGTIASGGAEHSVRIWDVRPPEPLNQDGAAMSVAFSRQGLLASADKSSVWLWNQHAGRPRAELRGPGGTVHNIAFGPGGRILAAAADDGIRLWKVRTREQLGDIHGRHDGIVRDVAFSPKGKILASVGATSGLIRLWDVRTRKELRPPFHGLTNLIFARYSLAFSPNGRLLASAGDNDTIRLWSVRTHHQVGQFRGDTDFVIAVAFSPDGRMLASGSDDGTVRLWNVATRREVGPPLEGHEGEVNAVAFSPDGETLASAGDDSTVRLWDVRTGRPLGLPLLHETPYTVQDVAFSPDGLTLASAGRDWTVRLWRGIFWHSFAGLRAQVCRLVVGSLTQAQVREFAAGLPYKPACPS